MGLYINSTKCLVSDRWQNLNWVWQWRRGVRGGAEADQLTSLCNLLENVSCTDKVDKWVWSLTSDNVFSVSSLRHILDSSMDVSRHTYWNKVIPSKVLIFYWRLLLNRLPHKKNLQARNVYCSTFSCSDCGFFLEDSNHIFFHCQSASQVWSFVASWTGISLPRWSNGLELRNWLASASPDPKVTLVLHCICIASLWSIWRLRNDIVFSSGLFKKSHLLDYIVVNAFDWLSSRSKLFKIDWNVWLQFPLNIL
ncbi:uncharacterized protein [Rutidosis leptorrhynchoides]|uniref:uncharacterized protein n=1 Tax=Rutidosis leptorrhynchoides TaxID=125765 RepID=UPI003A9A0BC9